MKVSDLGLLLGLLLRECLCVSGVVGELLLRAALQVAFQRSEPMVCAVRFSEITQLDVGMVEAVLNLGYSK
jgi:hypothetical protein